MTYKWLQTASLAVCLCGWLVECQHQGFNPQFDDRWPGDIDRPYCPPDAQWPCYEPPFYPYDAIHVDMTDIGTVVGRSMIYAPYKYVNIFLGIPYARPPILERRFTPPEEPGLHWDQGIRYWDASYYRDACPHELWNFNERYFIPRNMSEDCLHVNVFAPNLTDRPPIQNRNFPVLIYVHGEDYKNGDSMRNPGHILAKKEVLVVTFNFRLGAIGFLSTLDDNAPGNYGLMDTIMVLEWVHRHIRVFGGDPDQVTLVGSGTGASQVGLLLHSPRSYLNLRPLFHRVIMMSGTDMCESAFVDTVWNANANTYARDLGREVGCDPEYNLPNWQLVQCLRGRHYDEMVNATASVHRRYGSLAGPFGPVVDGNILPKRPAEMREDKNFMKVPVITGVTRDEGSYLVQNITKDIIGLKISEGMDPGTFSDIVRRMVTARSHVRNVDEVAGAMEFEYTFWAKPDNETAVRQNLIDMWSDLVFGWCMDATLKSHSFCAESDPNCEPTYMYVFDHRSEFEILPPWMGVPHGKDVDYLFGAPFFNETLGNITNVIPEQFDWTYLDRNISEFVQDMWTNFTKYANPTTEWTRNISWFPFHQYNLSYLHISEFSYMDINFRQNHFAFWREYFPAVSVRNPITTTPQPTPRPLVQYQAATWSLFGACLLTIFVIAALGITIWRRGKSEADEI